MGTSWWTIICHLSVRKGIFLSFGFNLCVNLDSQMMVFHVLFSRNLCRRMVFHVLFSQDLVLQDAEGLIPELMA